MGAAGQSGVTICLNALSAGTFFDFSPRAATKKSANTYCELDLGHSVSATAVITDAPQILGIGLPASVQRAAFVLATVPIPALQTSQ